MEIQGSYLIGNAQDVVWQALNDPDVLRQCIPGCESLEQTGDGAFDASVVAKIGPVKAKFKTQVSLENVNAPQSYTLMGSSKAAAGFGKGKADVTLKPEGSGTRLDYVAQFQVGGKLAQVGSRLVTGATRKTADDFFGSLQAHLNQAGSVHSAQEEAPLDDASAGSGTESASEPLYKSRWVYLFSLAAAAALLWWGFSNG